MFRRSKVGEPYLRQFTCQRALTLDWNQETGTPMATHVWRKSCVLLVRHAVR